MGKRLRLNLIKMGTTLSVVIACISVTIHYIIPKYVYKLNMNFSPWRKPQSIAIIGGADGPTAIFLTSSYSTYVIPLVFATLSMAGFLYLKDKKINEKEKEDE